MPLVLPALTLVLGVALGPRLSLLPSLLLISSLGLFSISLVWRTNRAVRHFLVIGGCLTLGLARGHLAAPQPAPPARMLQPGTPFTFRGTIIGHPQVHGGRQSVIVELAEPVPAGLPLGHGSQILLRLPPLPQFSKGNRIEVLGELSRPQDVSLDTNSSATGIAAVVKKPVVRLLPGTNRSVVLRLIDLLNARSEAAALHLLPEPQASLLIAILYGDRSTLPDAIVHNFGVAGAAHILVVSGWNITVTVMFLLALLIRIGLHRHQAVVVAALFLPLYSLFVGPNPPLVRGALMALLVLCADRVGRPREPWTLLLVVVAITALVDPPILADLSFQLSVLGTAGLFGLTAPITALLEQTPLHRPFLLWTIEPLAATTGATLLVFPLALIHFGQLSWIGPLANVAMLPVVPPIMLLGTLANILGLLVPAAGHAIALLAWPLIQWLIGVAAVAALLPGNTANVEVPPFVLWGYYVLWLAWWGWREWRIPRAKAPISGGGSAVAPG